MMNEGAEVEVRKGMERYGTDFLCNKIIGYNEIREYIIGKTSIEEAIKRAQQKTRNLAKSQVTWLNNKL
jgi:tRNA dimethylallyltransferase